MGDFIITPTPETWWQRLKRKLHLQPSVQAAVIGAIALIIVGLLQHVWYAKENSDLKSKLSEKTARIQELELELTPFRTLAIEKFNKADADALSALAKTMTALQSDYSEALTKITAQQSQIEMLRAKTSPRSLTTDQRTKLLQSLQSATKGEVSVTYDVVDAEAGAYARQIESLLKEAKYKVVPFPPGRILSIGLPGVFMIIKSQKAEPPHAGQLQQLFSQAGIDLQGNVNPNIASTSNTVVIWIGQKP